MGASIWLPLVCRRYPDCPKAEGVKYIFVVRGEDSLLRGEL